MLAAAYHLGKQGSACRNRAAYPKSAQKELAVLHLIHDQKDLSRSKLAEITGLSAGLITGITQVLLKRGLITESRERTNSVGRTPVALSIRRDAAYVMGVDLGSFYLRVVVTDVVGNVVYSFQTETGLSAGREQVLAQTFNVVHEAMKACGIPEKAIAGIGMAHSGIVDSASGTVLSFPRPGQMAEWKNVPLQKMLEREFGLPCNLEDSVRAIALAERCFGIGPSCENFVYIDVGMGIGAGIFLDGNLYKGHGGGAGEFGHMTVEENGPLCCCGNNGCLEIMASCAAIIHAARSAIEQGVDSKIQEMVSGGLDLISVEIIADAARQNDSLAFRILHDAVSHIGVALADLVNLLNPGTVVFGGALFRAAPDLVGPLRTIIKQRALERSANQVQLRVSQLRSDAGAIGAARAVSDKVIESLYISSL
jgi:predicted NBD/HSP70 family sugar kinase